jgi:hypothetical protein
VASGLSENSSFTLGKLRIFSLRPASHLPTSDKKLWLSDKRSSAASGLPENLDDKYIYKFRYQTIYKSLDVKYI